MPLSPAHPRSLNRPALVEWYRRNRRRTRELFDLLVPEVYYTRPISLRNPIVFYEGHLPAFSIISLVRRGAGLPGVDDRLEALFARGIDPDSENDAAPRSGRDTRWPSRDEVLAFAASADDAVIKTLEKHPFDESRPAMQHGEAIFTALEHEAMHQETLLYMWHRLPHEQKRKPPTVRYETDATVPAYSRVTIPEGIATLGADREQIRFGWDNEFDEQQVLVHAFDIDTHSVTNADFVQFVEAGGYRQEALWSRAGWLWRQQDRVEHPIFWERRDGEWYWRGMFELIPLPSAWPVYVSQAEAEAFARWRSRRLPTEDEYHRAAFGSPTGAERSFPWGDAAADSTRANLDFASWEPVPAGSRSAAASAWGVHDLVGNGWEWTSSLFEPFPGFRPMASYPEYSADFFDGQHYVMKGASPATARELVRRSFRNWFRSNYPYMYAKFRTVGS